MGSRGSVIPFWIEKIKNKELLLITDPEMTRFMMTLEDAVDLVLYAFENGENGDLFVQKAPSANLTTLANALKSLYSSEIKIKIIGSRHGEKLYETLVTKEEMSKSIDLKNYFRIPVDNRDLNYDKYFHQGNIEMSKIEDYHSHNTYSLNVDEMKSLLLKLDIVKNDLK